MNNFILLLLLVIVPVLVYYNILLQLWWWWIGTYAHNVFNNSYLNLKRPLNNHNNNNYNNHILNTISLRNFKTVIDVYNFICLIFYHQHSFLYHVYLYEICQRILSFKRSKIYLLWTKLGLVLVQVKLKKLKKSSTNFSGKRHILEHFPLNYLFHTAFWR